MESGTSSWGDLHLGNQPLILAEEGFQLSLGSINSRIRDGVGDVLLDLALRNPQQSLVILLNDVQSGFEFAQLGSQIGITSNDRVELAIVGSPHSGFKAAELSPQLVILVVEVGDVGSVIVNSVVKVWIGDFVTSFSFLTLDWDDHCRINVNVILIVVLILNWLRSGGLNTHSDFLFDWNFNDIFDNHIILLFDHGIDWFLHFNHLLNVNWLFYFPFNFNLDHLLDCDWSFDHSLD